MSWERLARFRVVASMDKRGFPVGPVGTPRVKACSRNGKTRVYTPKSADLWKADISDAWDASGIVGPFPGPFRLVARFLFRRPRNQYTMKGKGKNLRYDAPTWNDKRGRWDADNCLKAVMDALTVDKERQGDPRPWVDDASVVLATAGKGYANPRQRAGVVITIWTWKGV